MQRLITFNSCAQDISSISSFYTAQCSFPAICRSFFALMRNFNSLQIVGICDLGSVLLKFYTCNLQVQLLFSARETIATLVKYKCKTFITLTLG